MQQNSRLPKAEMLAEGRSNARAGTRMCGVHDKTEWGKGGGMGRGEQDFSLVAASHHVSASAQRAAFLISHWSSCVILYVKGCGMSCDAGMDEALKLQNIILAIPLKYMCCLSTAVS